MARMTSEASCLRGPALLARYGSWSAMISKGTMREDGVIVISGPKHGKRRADDQANRRLAEIVMAIKLAKGLPDKIVWPRT